MTAPTAHFVDLAALAAAASGGDRTGAVWSLASADLNLSTWCASPRATASLSTSTPRWTSSDWW
jgi:hypothetical protein